MRNPKSVIRDSQSAVFGNKRSPGKGGAYMQRDRMRILLIEDNPGDARLIEEMLRQAGGDGFDLDCAGQLSGALERLSGGLPDVILSDLGLPDSAGLATLAAVHARAPEVPIIVLTGLNDDTLARQAVREGAQDYLVKGRFEWGQLARATRYAVERQRAVDAAATASRRWQETFDAMSDQVAILDRDHRIVLANRSLRQAFAGRQVVGARCYELFGCGTEPPAGCSVSETFDTGEPTTGDSREHQFGDAWYEVRVSPIRESDGEIRQVLHITRDITEHRRLEQQFLQAQKMETVGRLAGGVAHDFNNILTAIAGYAAMARNVLPAGFSARADIEEVLKSAHRAAELTHQLLAFSRQQAIAPRVINLNDLLLDLQKMLRRLIGEDVDLRVITAPGPALVNVDAGQIEQVLVNLVVNARDAMPRGGRLAIQTSHTEVDEAFVRVHPGATAGTFVVLSIRDNGSGMTDEVRARIFEPFFTTKERGQGTGLGLATAFGIVKQHHGNIWCESKPGVGTRFEIFLPAVQDRLAESLESESADFSPHGKEVVLVVEDEMAVRDLTVRLLRNLGYLVLEAPNGQQALKMAFQVDGRVDLLLTDVVMPKMSGKALADEVRRRYPDVKVLFMSGYTAEALTRHDIAEGEGVALLEKPFRDVTLARRVRELLDGRRL